MMTVLVSDAQVIARDIRLITRWYFARTTRGTNLYTQKYGNQYAKTCYVTVYVSFFCFHCK